MSNANNWSEKIFSKSESHLPYVVKEVPERHKNKTEGTRNLD